MKQYTEKQYREKYTEKYTEKGSRHFEGDSCRILHPYIYTNLIS